jgi:Tol biopolymer transport system component
VRDIQAGTTELLEVTQNGLQFAAGASAEISGDGNFVAFATSQGLVPDDTGGADLYLYDRSTRLVTPITPGLTDVRAFGAAISGDGAWLGFTAAGENSPDVTGLDGASIDVMLVRNPVVFIFESGYE